MSGTALYLLIILLSPLLGFIFNFAILPSLVGGMKNTKASTSGAIATLMIAVSFVFSVIVVLGFTGENFQHTFFNWLQFSKYEISFGLEITSLSAIMILIVSGVGSLIHLFSIGYMAKEVGAARFFAYLNLFCFMMLLLVLSDSLLFTFFGWEGVGLCSLLLIGYWYQNEEFARFGNKAFIMNRIGDFGFMAGMFILFYEFGSMKYSVIQQACAVEAIDPIVAASAGFFLFIGATGKSAQIPLYTWLPDAMVGPTPVSALIHAATMVTAGVFLCTKLNCVFIGAPGVMTGIAFIGVLTALLGAIIALGQTDIKKVLAYSTVSQLGFMFLAVGVGAFQVAIFHLMTHAFFKALLFLSAGSVIHGCDGEQDMRKMGGLKAKMPVTYLSMFVGLLALAGIPLFAGFFSKDEILYFASQQGDYGWVLVGLGFIASALTALYSGRLLKLTFFDEYRGKAHVHESPTSMLLPLVVLSALSAFGGFLGIPHGMSELVHIRIPNLIDKFLKLHIEMIGNKEVMSEAVVSLIATGLAGFFFFWGFKKANHAKDPEYILANKLFVDELYHYVIIKPLQGVQWAANKFIEGLFVQNISNGVAKSVRSIGDIGRFVQKTGDVNVQLIFTFVSIVIFVVYWFF